MTHIQGSLWKTFRERLGVCWGKNRRCFLVASEGFLEEREKAPGQGVMTRWGLGHRKGKWRC